MLQTPQKFNLFKGYRTRAKMEDDRITLIHAVEIYRSIYTAPWFQGKGQAVHESNICCDFIPISVKLRPAARCCMQFL